MVFAGPKKEYASTIIIINYIMLAVAGQRRVAYNTFAELPEAEVYELVQQESIGSTAHCLPVQVKKYVNLYKEFDSEEGVNQNRKLRRAFLEERYRELIDAIYADQTEVPIEARIRHQDGGWNRQGRRFKLNLFEN